MLFKDYGFQSVCYPSTWSDVKISEAELHLKKQFERLASMISVVTGLPLIESRLYCGFQWIHLKIVDEHEIAEEVGASFNPSSHQVTIKVGNQWGAHFGHEWAHALDSYMGNLLSEKKETSLSGLSIQKIKEAAKEPAPYQSILGALASARLQSKTNEASYASTSSSVKNLPAFNQLIQFLLPQASGYLKYQKANRLRETECQHKKILDFALTTSEACLSQMKELNGLLNDQQKKQVAIFCAHCLEARTKEEGCRRKGRDFTLDLIKNDLVELFTKSFRLDMDLAKKTANALLHISPIKSYYDDFFAAPYTGRSTWAQPASLADLSCTLIRLERNKLVLTQQKKLSKEKFMPLNFWWTLRRQVSEESQSIIEYADQLLVHLVQKGFISSNLTKHSEAWNDRHKEYKAGALIFSDLVSTGTKMLIDEADLHGQVISKQEALALRKKITNPINQLAHHTTVIETFAESFEQFIVYQSQKKTPLGKICKEMIDSSFIDSDEDELLASLDPSTAWMHNKSSHPEKNAQLWKALIKSLPSYISLNTHQALKPGL